MRSFAHTALAIATAFTALTAGARPTPPSRPAGTCAPLAVKDARLSHAVEKRQAVGEADVYEPGDTVNALVVMHNEGPEVPVEMVWKRDGAVKSRVRLDVGTGKGWRTWSRHTVGARDVGAWTVEVRAEDGSLLDTLSFEVARSIAGR